MPKLGEIHELTQSLQQEIQQLKLAAKAPAPPAPKLPDVHPAVDSRLKALETTGNKKPTVEQVQDMITKASDALRLQIGTTENALKELIKGLDARLTKLEQMAASAHKPTKSQEAAAAKK